MTKDDRQPAPNTLALPANRAFVVQFRAITTENKDIFQGRIEHLASGKVENFRTEVELRGIISELLSSESL